MKYSASVLFGLALLWFSAGSAAAEVKGTWGAGLIADYDVPAFKLNQWFPSGGPKLGGVVSYVVNETWTAEVEGYFAKYGGGELEDRRFLWSIDGNEYASPQARSEMVWGVGMINWVRHFDGGGAKLEQGGGAPYLVLGSGFAHYKNKVSGLIFPGQNREPLDTSILMRPVADRRTALAFTAGLGVEYFATESMAIDFRGQYNLVMGTVRPLEAWGLEEVFPFQKVNVGVRLKLYFPK